MRRRFVEFDDLRKYRYSRTPPADSSMAVFQARLLPPESAGWTESTG
jgi:hypothetical protein